MIKEFKNAISTLLVLTLITGLLYPALVTAIAQLIFPWQANGSLLQQNQKIIGSHLIGQPFVSEKYFWSRPSATTPFPYDAQHSTGSNMAVANPVFLAHVKERADVLHRVNAENHDAIPVELVTASGSGLDPDISPIAAFYQVQRVAKARQVSEETIKKLIQDNTTQRTFGLLGEPRVNVLQLNTALDQLITQENQHNGR